MRKYLHILLLLIVYFSIADSSAQINSHLYDNWLMGDMVQINVMKKPGRQVGNGTLMKSIKSGASISDSTGKLLFYVTQQGFIYDSTDRMMKNSNNLMFESGLWQSVVIIPCINKPYLYKVYTVFGVLYTVTPYRVLFEYTVDMRENGGKGAVIGNGREINRKICDGMTVVFSEKEKCYWLIVHEIHLEKFLSYKIDFDGTIATSPIKSQGYRNLGKGFFFADSGYVLNQFKSSVDGTLISSVNARNKEVDIYYFDAATGKLSRAMTFDCPGEWKTGSEFSENNKYLYICGEDYRFYININAKLYQCEIAGMNPAKASKPFVKQLRGYTGNLQLAPNAYIYGSDGFGNIFAIKDPDLPDLATFDDNPFPFVGDTRGAFPSAISQILIIRDAEIHTLDTCPSLLNNFWLKYPPRYSVPEWDFGDGHIATGVEVVHSYRWEGEYTIKVSFVQWSRKVTLTMKYNARRPGRWEDLGPDIILSKDIHQLDAGPEAELKDSKVSWSTGDTTRSITITHTGTYSYVITNPYLCSILSDTIQIIFLKDIPDVPDTLTCTNGDFSYKVDLKYDIQAYWWDNQLGDTYHNNKSGKYFVSFALGPLHVYDTFRWTFIEIPKPVLSRDTSLCSNDGYLVTIVRPPNVKVHWSTGDTGSFILVTNSGTYSVQFSMGQCVSTSSINVMLLPPVTYYTTELEFCPDGLIPMKLVAPSFGKMTSYFWPQNNNNKGQIIIDTEGEYSVVITKPNGCIRIDTFKVQITCPASFYVPNAFTPDQDPLNPTWKPVCQYVGEYYCVIFNRWGQRIWETNNLKDGWDGTFRGQLMPEDIYTYSLWYKGEKRPYNTAKFKRGTITLLRP